jgi:site-specific recombinase XerD
MHILKEIVVMKNNDFQSLLQRFFLERLINQQNASACTILSYRDTFRILLKYAHEYLGISASSFSIKDIAAENVLKFLNHLEQVRKNKPETINNRLAAIKSFLEYVSYECPEYLGIIRKIKIIPSRKSKHKNIGYLTKEEIDSLIESCDISSQIGRRDRIMILLLFNSGMRVSEMANLKGSNVIRNNGHCQLTVLGKGRKERTIPLWSITEKILAKYIHENSIRENDYLLVGRNVLHLTRSGIRNRINYVVEKAELKCPSLKKKNITPHVFRHSTAMALLQAGIDLSTIAIWLGHESIETTHKYMTADIALKEKALAKLSEPQKNCKIRRYKPCQGILQFLENL